MRGRRGRWAAQWMAVRLCDVKDGRGHCIEGPPTSSVRSSRVKRGGTPAEKGSKVGRRRDSNEMSGKKKT